MVKECVIYSQSNFHTYPLQPLATDIPTSDSLNLTSSAETKPSDPSLPPAGSTQTSLKRDDWILAPPSSLIAPTNAVRTQLPTGDESFTDEYGDAQKDSRNVGGGVDFFSSLGTETKKKRPLLDRPEAAQVRVRPKIPNHHPCPHLLSLLYPA